MLVFAVCHECGLECNPDSICSLVCRVWRQVAVGKLSKLSKLTKSQCTLQQLHYPHQCGSTSQDCSPAHHCLALPCLRLSMHCQRFAIWQSLAVDHCLEDVLLVVKAKLCTLLQHRFLSGLLHDQRVMPQFKVLLVLSLAQQQDNNS